MKCGFDHPAALQFHHRNPNKKEKELSMVYESWSIERIMKEIKKCEVLCANCHFKFHWKQKHGEFV